MPARIGAEVGDGVAIGAPMLGPGEGCTAGDGAGDTIAIATARISAGDGDGDVIASATANGTAAWAITTN